MPLPMYPAQQDPQTHPFDQIKNVIAIAAGKGGVGKSTVAVNCALALQRFGYSVGLLDADVYGPSIRKLLPEDTPPQQKGEMIIPAICHGIKVISMAYFGKSEQSASVRAPIANGIVTQFIDKVSWGPLDYLIIDFPPGTGDIQMTLGQKARLSGALMVTTPQEVAMMDVRKAMQLFRQLNIPIVGVVENMSYYLHPQTREELYLFGRGGGERLANEYQLPYLGGIPIHPIISTYGDAGRSIFDTDAEETVDVQKAFMHIMRNFLKSGNKTESQPVFMEHFEQIDEASLKIRWSDGKTHNYTVSELQSYCPCAACMDHSTGLRRAPYKAFTGLISKKIMNVGRYALRFEFSSGCSSGIYDYALLRGIKGQ